MFPEKIPVFVSDFFLETFPEYFPEKLKSAASAAASTPNPIARPLASLGARLAFKVDLYREPASAEERALAKLEGAKADRREGLRRTLLTQAMDELQHSAPPVDEGAADEGAGEEAADDPLAEEERAAAQAVENGHLGRAAARHHGLLRG